MSQCLRKEAHFSFSTMASLSDFSWCKFRGQQIYNAPRRVKTRPLCESYIMSLPCCSSLSWCFLCLLLALSLHHACSAPDFSGKFFFLRFCDTQLNIALQPHRHFPKKSVWEVTYFSHILCKIAVKCQLRRGDGPGRCGCFQNKLLKIRTTVPPLLA